MKLQSYPEPAMAICCDLGLAIFIDKLLVIISFFFSTTVLGIYPHIPISLPPMRFWSMAPLLWKASGDIHCWIVWRLSPCVQQYQTEPMLHCLPPPVLHIEYGLPSLCLCSKFPGWCLVAYLSSTSPFLSLSDVIMTFYVPCYACLWQGLRLFVLTGLDQHFSSILLQGWYYMHLRLVSIIRPHKLCELFHLPLWQRRSLWPLKNHLGLPWWLACAFSGMNTGSEYWSGDTFFCIWILMPLFDVFIEHTIINQHVNSLWNKDVVRNFLLARPWELSSWFKLFD